MKLRDIVDEQELLDVLCAAEAVQSVEQVMKQAFPRFCRVLFEHARGRDVDVATGMVIMLTVVNEALKKREQVQGRNPELN